MARQHTLSSCEGLEEEDESNLELISRYDPILTRVEELKRLVCRLFVSHQSGEIFVRHLQLRQSSAYTSNIPCRQALRMLLPLSATSNS